MWMAILKHEIRGKHSEKHKKKQLTENQTTSKYQNTSWVRGRLLHLACQGGG